MTLNINKKQIKRFFSGISSITPIQLFISTMVCLSVIFCIKYFSITDTHITVVIEVKGKTWTEDWNNTTVGNEYRPPWWLAKEISINDKEYDPGGKEIAKIISIEEIPDIKPFIYLTTNLSVIKNNRTNKYIFKGKPLMIGSDIELELPKTKIVGQIISLNSKIYSSPLTTLIVKGFSRAAEPWIYKSISIGDKMTNLSTGEILLEIIDFQVSQSNMVYFTNPDYYTNLFLDNNTRLRDITATVKLKAYKTPYGYVFANKQLLKIGQPLPLFFPKYTLNYFEIQEINEEKQLK